MKIIGKNLRSLLLAGLVLVGPGLAWAAEDDHAGHDHMPAKTAMPTGAVATAGHDEHGGHAGRGEEEDTVHLSPDALKAANLVMEAIGPGKIFQSWNVPGEIQFNADGIAKVGARVPGQVLEIHAAIGAKVATGDLLAVLQSTELGNAKIEYFTGQVNLELAQKENTRTQDILTNTRALLKMLDEPIPPEELNAKAQGLKIGEIKSRLINARSAAQLAQAVAARAAQLKKDNLVTEAELELRNQEAESARVLYAGAREEAELQGAIAALQTERELRLATLSAQNAERRLHIFGFSDAQVAKMTGENDETVARYEIRAPRAGTIIDRNLAEGEKIGDDHTAFLLADLSNVWCNIQVTSQKLGTVRTGQRLVINVPGSDAAIESVIDTILPSINERSRNGSARALLDNSAGLLKPGMFVTVRIETEQISVPLVVRTSAVHSLENRMVVFVASADGDEFTAKTITPGRQSSEWIEILSGLEIGESVVIMNGFVLKAELGKAGAKHEH